MSYLRLLLLSLIVMYSCKSSNKVMDNGIPIYTFDFENAETLSDVIESAHKYDKLIFLDVYTDWCLPCKVMDEDVFTNKKLGAYINEHFVSYKVNAEKNSGSMIADLYKVRGYPTLLFLDLNGNILVEKQGSANYREMYELADEAIALNGDLGE